MPAPEFSVNTTRYDPYRTFQFKVMWGGKYVAGVSKVSSLTRTTQVVKHREGGSPALEHRSPPTDRIQRHHPRARRDP